MAARKPKPQEQIESGPPRRVEIRIDGRIHFVNDCYDSALNIVDDTVKFTAALHPTLVDVVKRPPERFEDDPRNSETVIQQVHSGRRDQVAAPSPKET